MTGPAPAHLLIIDSDARLRDLLGQYLKTQGFLVSAARDADHARRLLEGLEFDLIVLDARLPGADALDADVATPILRLVPKGTGLGDAGEWIEKPFEPKVLCEKINGVLDRRPPQEPAGPEVVWLGDLRFEVEAGRLMRGDEPVRLTSTEVQLMRIFAANLGEPIGRGELVAQLGRSGHATKARAVDVQITRLRRKVEANPKSPRHLQTVRGAGYMLVAD